MNVEWMAVFWAAITIGVYAVAVRVHRRFRAWWSSPLLLTWGLCGALLLGCHANYREYLSGTQWLVTLLGPATVAFAIPIHENRLFIRRHWRLLVVGTLFGSALAVGSAWTFAYFFDLPPEFMRSLLPRSISTPFAMTASQDLGGVPELTAVFTAVTGIFGATIGEILLFWLPLRSSFARGALLGMGAHGAGAAKARELGEEEGVVAALMMIFAGLFNILFAVTVARL